MFEIKDIFYSRSWSFGISFVCSTRNISGNRIVVGKEPFRSLGRKWTSVPNGLLRLSVIYSRLVKYTQNTYVPNGGARGMMVIIVGNGYDDTISNPGRSWLHFRLH